jgi:hypothetical protein
MHPKLVATILGFILLITGSVTTISNGSLINKASYNDNNKEIFRSTLDTQLHMKTTLLDMSKLFPIGNKQAFEGYTLFTPWFSIKTYLINNSWKVVHSWKSLYQPGLPVYLLENGNLLRGCFIRKPGFVWGAGDTGRVEMFDWNGTLLWYFEYANASHCLHHDIKPLPNGNILMIAWEVKTRDDAIAAGCNPDLVPEDVVWPDEILEVKPSGSSGGEIVWEWHVWDHMIQDYDPSKENYGVVGDHPELIDVNLMAQNMDSDWTHINSIDYNETFDQILVNAPLQSEIWIIDHSTTTTEAAGHTGGKNGQGGDLLYRWGNPQCYRAGDANDQQLFEQHDAEWIKSGCPGAGHITVFNNGNSRPEGMYSSVDEIIPPVDDNGSYYLEPGTAYEPQEPVWAYTAKNPTDFYAPGQSSAQRLPNGNTLICNGPRGVLFEVTPEKKTVWFYVNLLVNLIPGGFNLIFQAHRYPLNYSGIKEASLNIKNENFIRQSVTPLSTLLLPDKITKFFTRTQSLYMGINTNEK